MSMLKVLPMCVPAALPSPLLPPLRRPHSAASRREERESALLPNSMAVNPSGRHRICAGPPIRTRHDVAGFSLLEMMVAVTLLAIIIVGLLSMFYQTQRAFRQGSTQSDVLEG